MDENIDDVIHAVSVVHVFKLGNSIHNYRDWGLNRLYQIFILGTLHIMSFNSLTQSLACHSGRPLL